MRVEFRPTVASDIGEIVSEKLPHRIRAITAIVRDQARERVLAIGGLGYRPDGAVIAFMVSTDEFRKYPAAVHRAGVMGMKLIRESGVPRVLAEAQAGNAAAEPWLERFGFRSIESGGRRAFLWERAQDVE